MPETTAAHLRCLAKQARDITTVLYVDADRGNRVVRLSDWLLDAADRIERGAR